VHGLWARLLDRARNVAALEDRQRIKLVPRRGAFVVQQSDPGWQLQVTQGFFEIEVDQHHSVETRVLEATQCVLPQSAASALEVSSGTRGSKLARVRRLDGRLALYSVNYLLLELEPLVRASDVMSGGGSLSRLLKSAGYDTFRARRSVEAMPAPAPIAALLEVSLSHPLLLVTSVSWNRLNKPFDFYASWLKSDVVKVVVEAQPASASV
jgi:GntR family transcriptional regulator